MPNDAKPVITTHYTGVETAPLAGGRSRLTAQGVPVLELRDDLAAALDATIENALDPNTETEYLTGAVVRLHNPAPQGSIAADDDVVVFHIGGETLDEAAKSVVGLFESTFGSQPPTWVESTDSRLAEVLADHYGGIEIREVAE